MDTLETLTIRRGCVSSIIDILKTSPVAEKEQNLRKIKHEMSINMTYTATSVINKLKEMLKVIDQEIRQNQHKQKLDVVLKMIDKEIKQNCLLRASPDATAVVTTSPTPTTTVTHQKKNYPQLRKQVKVELTRISIRDISDKKARGKKISPKKSSLKKMLPITYPAVSKPIQTKYSSYLNSVTVKLVKNLKHSIDHRLIEKKIDAVKVNHR